MPERLYRAWPWLCLALAGALLTMRWTIIAVPLGGYAVWVLRLRGNR